MRIAVLSGKGGAGKTFVSVNLAASFETSTYCDCDVEAPNGFIFLKPERIERDVVCKNVAVVDDNRCIGCQSCVQFCKFNALAFTGGKMHVFNEVCHGCTGCALVCPNEAIHMKAVIVGSTRKGWHKNMLCKMGELMIGEASGMPIVNALLNQSPALHHYEILDCPPGTACTTMACVKASDYCIMVVEPTTFGFHDFKMVHQLTMAFDKPSGIVINKVQVRQGASPRASYTFETDPLVMLRSYCDEHNIEILTSLPFDIRLSKQADVAIEKISEYQTLFLALASGLKGRLCL